MITEATIAQALSPKKLELIILPTEKCNFRCTYCYEDFSIGKMAPPIVQGIKNLIKNRSIHLDALNISWFGGEPLLAKSIIQDIGSYAHNLCQKNGVFFRSGFTTNGYLLDKELLKSLLKISHNNYQITLDGDAHWHNKTRLLANRSPTFSKIWENLISLKDVPGNFSIMLRLHIHRDNIESVKRLYSRLVQEILPDKRFSVYFHKVSNLNPDGSPIAQQVLRSEEYKDAIEHIIDGHPPTDDYAISEEHLKGYICYAAMPNSLMIRANGTIGKCTVALSDDTNNLGKINPDGTLDISNEKLRRWLTGYIDMSEKTLACPMSTMHSQESILRRVATT